jgi:hypothetical protein
VGLIDCSSNLIASLAELQKGIETSPEGVEITQHPVQMHTNENGKCHVSYQRIDYWQLVLRRGLSKGFPWCKMLVP